jgi:hypothetical protein
MNSILRNPVLNLRWVYLLCFYSLCICIHFRINKLINEKGLLRGYFKKIHDNRYSTYKIENLSLDTVCFIVTDFDNWVNNHFIRGVLLYNFNLRKVCWLRLSLHLMSGPKFTVCNEECSASSDHIKLIRP